MRFFSGLILAGLLSTTSAFAQGGAPGGGAPPVTGTVKSFDGKTLVVTANGADVSMAVPAATRITTNVPKTLADIKPGDFIASGGTRGPDGKIHANEIRIFAAPAGEGQFPMQQPNQVMTNASVTAVMTNATVSQVSGGGAPMIKLSFHGAGAPGSANCTGRAADAPGGAGTGCVGETEFDVPAGIPVVAVVPVDASALKPGAKVTVNTAKAADGSVSAARIQVTQ